MARKMLHVASAAFQNDGYMPVRYTGYGADESPPLTLTGLIPEVKSVAVVMADLDIPVIREFPHWLIWNLPVQTEIPGGIPQGEMLGQLGSARQGLAYGRHMYRGPKPPRFIRMRHRYVFTVYALDMVLDISSDAKHKDLMAAMRGHVLQQGTLTGLYKNGRVGDG